MRNTRGGVGEGVFVKADLGYMRVAGGDGRTNVVSILLEPSLTLGNFSTAFTGFVMIDNDSLVNSASLFKLDDEMFFYIEPGYTFTENFGFGLPIEFHAADLADKNDNAMWLVPTFYVYPFENVQWWIWGQVVKYIAEGKDNAFGLGSEIIVNY